MSVAKLIEKIHKDDCYWELCRVLGYGGLRFHLLAEKVKPLIVKYGSKKVSAALFDLAAHVGWVTALNPDGRKAAWSVLGPPPEKWDEWYTGMDGKPQPRAEHHKVPPEVPKPEPDPILDGLTRKTATELDTTLRQSRAVLRKADSPPPSGSSRRRRSPASNRKWSDAAKRSRRRKRRRRRPRKSLRRGAGRRRRVERLGRPGSARRRAAF